MEKLDVMILVDADPPKKVRLADVVPPEYILAGKLFTVSPRTIGEKPHFRQWSVTHNATGREACYAESRETCIKLASMLAKHDSKVNWAGVKAPSDIPKNIQHMLGKQIYSLGGKMEDELSREAARLARLDTAPELALPDQQQIVCIVNLNEV